jgi:hypothetical protein
MALVGMPGLGTVVRAADVQSYGIRPRTTDVIKATIYVGFFPETTGTSMIKVVNRSPYRSNAYVIAVR